MYMYLLPEVGQPLPIFSRHTFVSHEAALLRQTFCLLNCSFVYNDKMYEGAGQRNVKVIRIRNVLIVHKWLTNMQ